MGSLKQGNENNFNILIFGHYTETKLRGLSPQMNYIDRATPLVGEVRANLCV
jgi:hypothetical protein